jgi:hypothetical protein
MIEQILKYLLPDGADAPQRVALRPSGIFVGILIVGLAIAFGSDTISIIGRSISRHTGIQISDLPLTATTLSVAVPLLILGLTYLIYWTRFPLIRFWSLSWFQTYRTVGIGTSLPATSLLHNILAYFDNDLPGKAAQADNIEKEAVQHARHRLNSFGFIEPKTRTDEQKQEVSELSAEREMNDRTDDAYQARASQVTGELIALVGQLLAELERLSVYLQRKQREPLEAPRPKPRNETTPESKPATPPPAALNIQGLGWKPNKSVA